MNTKVFPAGFMPAESAIKPRAKESKVQLTKKPWTSYEFFTPKGSKLDGKWDPFFQENPGWWNIINWPKNIQNSHPFIGGLDLMMFWTNKIEN